MVALALSAFALFATIAPSVALPTKLDARQTMPNPPVVQTQQGPYRGRYLEGYEQNVWLNVQYAQQPVGSLRFRKPVALNTTWTEPQDATQYGKTCPQAVVAAAGEEDCLGINVIAPASAKAGDSLPVYVHLHGGGFVAGTATAATENGTFIVQRSVEMDQPVLFVSFNYRLGSFGFLASKDVEAEGNLNAGLYDQRLALEWIRDNIEAFGGSKDRIMATGVSAGGASPMFHVLAESASRDNLFSKMIVMSAPYYLRQSQTAELFEAQYQQVATNLRCGDAPNKLECLRAVPFADLQAALSLVPAQPVPDGDIYTVDRKQRLLDGNFHKIPAIFGHCTDEAVNSPATPKGINTSEEFAQFLMTGTELVGYPANVTDRVFELYPDIPHLGSPYNTGDGVPSTGLQDKRVASLNGDLIFIAERRFSAQAVSKQQDRTYSYRFNQYKQGIQMEEGVPHGADLPFMLNLRKLPPPQGDFALGSRQVDLDTSRLMMSYFISFAASGDPNTHIKDIADAPRWPAYNEAQEELVFERKSHAAPDDYRKEAMQWINSLA